MVVLFDEIEKAHKLVLDKFLQILEDGRLTDGRASRRLLRVRADLHVETSGSSGPTRRPGVRDQLVHPDMPYPELEATVKAAIREHFTTGDVGRPNCTTGSATTSSSSTSSVHMAKEICGGQ